ncbi:MAG: response regulator [Candidatus Methylomirabilota bacterium]|jgi:CheY-like chemotaxis protein
MTTATNQENKARARVLVVDDDPRVRETTLLGLRSRGYPAEGAEDGLQALHHLQHGQFDVVVTDIQMPRLDGLALLLEIRRRGYTQGVVVQTTLLDPSLEVVLRRVGASRVLMKGGPFADLVRSVEEAYRASRQSPVQCA